MLSSKWLLIPALLAAASCGSGGGSTPPQATDAGSPANGTVLHTLTLSSQGAGHGVIKTGTLSDQCRAGCFQQFPAGTRIHLEAVADAGSTFQGWAADCAGTGGCDLVLDADRAAVAVFNLNAPPPPPGSHTVTLAFARGAGRVTSLPAGLDCTASCSAAFAEGTALVLTATPAAASTFAGWSGACTGAGPCRLVVNNDLRLEAAFDAAPPPPPPPPPDACAAIRPHDPGPAPHQHRITTTAQGGIVGLPGMADGSGALAFEGMIFDHVNGSSAILDFVAPTGEATRAGEVDVVLRARQQAGFVVEQDVGQNALLVRRNSRGDTTATTPIVGNDSSIVENPVGGVVRLALDAPRRVESYDDALGLRWSTPVRRQTLMAVVGVDRLGNTLVAFEADPADRSVDAHWIDQNGVAGPIFKLLPKQGDPPYLTGVDLAPRIGGGFFVGVDGFWQAQVDSGSTVPTPPPDWLASRLHTKLHTVHGGAGYAVLPVTAASEDCSQTVEVVTPSGDGCGTATFRVGGGSCHTNEITVGYDGTVIQKISNDRETICAGGDSSVRCTATWQWWPAFFR